MAKPIKRPAPKPVKKEVIKPPNKKELGDAAKLLRKGDPAGARVMADKAVAVRQKPAKPARKKP